jgi:hypothetical protein
MMSGREGGSSDANLVCVRVYDVFVHVCTCVCVCVCASVYLHFYDNHKKSPHVHTFTTYIHAHTHDSLQACLGIAHDTRNHHTLHIIASSLSNDVLIDGLPQKQMQKFMT